MSEHSSVTGVVKNLDTEKAVAFTGENIVVELFSSHWSSAHLSCSADLGYIMFCAVFLGGIVTSVC